MKITNASLLRFFLSYADYQKFHKYVNTDWLNSESRTILEDFAEYYAKYKQDIDLEAFIAWFHQVKHTSLPKTKRQEYNLILENVATADLEKIQDIIEKFQEESTKDQIREAIEKKLSPETIRNLVTDYESKIRALDEEVQGESSMDLEDFWESGDRSHGLKFRLDCLNKGLAGLVPGDMIIVAAFVDGGKCNRFNTPIRMYDGTVKMVQDVVVGDLLMGDDSKPRTVLKLARGRDTMYTVHQKNGDDYGVNAAHVLTGIFSDTRKYYKDFPAGEVFDLPLDRYLSMPASVQTNFKGVKVGIEYPENFVLLDPYALGLWLGDGTALKPEICSMNQKIVEYWKNFGESLGLSCSVRHQPNNQASMYYLSSKGMQQKSNALTAALRVLGVWGEKAIPAEYLVNSRRVRQALLAGLMDTDGSFNGRKYEITQVRKNLAMQILDLCRSLGYYASISDKIIAGKTYYRVTFSGDTRTIPFLRLEHSSGSKKRRGLYYGISVTCDGRGDYYGFVIDGNHRYLLGDYTVTHNTAFSISEATFMAQQLTGEDCVCWFNNEEPDKRVKYKLYSSMLSAPVPKVRDNWKQAKAAYLKKVGGFQHRIRFFDMRGKGVRYIEQVCEKYKPRLIILDQIDKMKGGGYSKDGAEHIRIKNLYGEVRDRVAKLAPVLAVSQCDATTRWKDKETQQVQYQRVIDQTQLDGSKVGKPGEADAIITIGQDVRFPASRYISICKNKMEGIDDNYRHLRGFEVGFDGALCQYTNPKSGEYNAEDD